MTYSEKVMKKCILLFVILNICAISNLHSQWLEKEGYWELSEKIPDLRDLKILPDENLIITVSKDNTIRHIEYDSGKILKFGKPSGITDDNDYAKISNDGKTTVVARYVKNESTNGSKDIMFSIVNNSTFQIESTFNITQFDLFSKQVIEDTYSLALDINFSDYISLNNKIILRLLINRTWVDRDYLNRSHSNSYLIGKLEDGKFIFSNDIKSFDDNQSKNIENLNLFKYKLISTHSSSYEYLNGNKATGNSRNVYLGLINSDLDSIATVFDYDYSYSWVYDSGSSSSGYDFKLQQILNSDSGTHLYLRAADKLFTFDIKTCELTDSISNRIFSGNVQISTNNNYIHSIHQKSYNEPAYYHINILPDMRYIYTLQVAIYVNPNFPIPFIDEANKKVHIVSANGSILLIKPEVMKDISESGFIWSKDTVEVGEEIDFTALVNIDSYEYEWEFDDGEKITSSEKSIRYKYDYPGMKTVKLTVITPKNEKYEFKKDTIINVWEVLKADFEIETLNSELPLKVRFTDKSRGTIISWKWDFGDGGLSTEQNPIHEYNYAGDFSPRLIVSNSLDRDTFTLFEGVKFRIGKVDAKKSTLSNIENTALKSLNLAYLVNDGFILDYRYAKSIYSYEVYINSKLLDLVYLDYNYNKKNTWSNVYLIGPDFNPDNKIDYSWRGFFEGKGIFNFFVISFSFSDFVKIDLLQFKIIKEISISGKNYVSNANKAYYLPDNTNIFIGWHDKNIFKADSSLNLIWSLDLKKSQSLTYYSDTLNNNLHILHKFINSVYNLSIVSYEGEILNTFESFSLDTNIILTNIKSVNDNLILLHGYYNDKANKTTYAYFAKYHPLDNTLQDTILYSRKDICKIERVNNSTYAAIGQSRGRQGYLLLDTNLHQIKDIRVDSLTGEIKDMIFHDKKVYLFTEKIVSLETMALGAKESYQTTASVLSLPEEIIASLEDTPIIFTDKLTHSAYPNPTNEVLNLKVLTNESANYTIKLYDIFGTEILNIHDGFIPANSEKIFSIPTSSLSIGSYYYVISGGGIVEGGKVMVVR